jgi:hypothetical protein
MSYDLFFYTQGDLQISKEKLQDYFSTLPYFSGEWNYRNPYTGVYFSFVHVPPGDKTKLKAKTGFLGARLAFNIDYNKPTFFAHEAMPVVAALCQQLDLQVLDPQDHVIQGNQQPKIAKAEELVASWVKVNRMAVRVYRYTIGGVLYYSRQKGQQWWTYQYHLPAIRQQLGDAIAAPDLLLLQDRSARMVCSTAAWRDASPSLFPPCERVIIFRTAIPDEQGHKGTPTFGWVEADELRLKLAGYMDKLETDAGVLDVLRPEKAPLVQPIFQTLPLNSGVETFKKIPPDGLVDEG